MTCIAVNLLPRADIPSTCDLSQDVGRFPTKPQQLQYIVH